MATFSIVIVIFLTIAAPMKAIEFAHVITNEERLKKRSLMNNSNAHLFLPNLMNQNVFKASPY